MYCVRLPVMAVGPVIGINHSSYNNDTFYRMSGLDCKKITTHS